MNVLMMLTAVSAFAYAPDFTYASEEGIEMSDTLSAVTVVTDFKQSLPLIIPDILPGHPGQFLYLFCIQPHTSP